MPAIYDDWEAAYDACREANAPLIVRVGGEAAKIFPSGGFKSMAEHKQEPDPLDAALEATGGDIDPDPLGATDNDIDPDPLT